MFKNLMENRKKAAREKLLRRCLVWDKDFNSLKAETYSRAEKLGFTKEEIDAFASDEMRAAADFQIW